ncbi:hypothetical protein J7T55_004886 [Diaporthe amygdali]|uniref:uncharacterized protein n=1 Tax=Phomopsis amygdali TaxID=1214568 RepID=UPI0022FE06B0|nr:uncharacterized protein J7T55_004886 [Diaporthe amygdali]KAJ0114642.1 hypothetical protein J7T55_004886 [Diaporthe amygdali]
MKNSSKFLSSERLGFSSDQKPRQMLEVLLRTPRDKAIKSIRCAMASLVQASRGLLAQELVKKLEISVCVINGDRFYPL